MRMAGTSVVNRTMVSEETCDWQAGPERLTGARYRPTYEIRAHVWHLDGSGAPVAVPYQDRIGQSVRDLGRASWDADQPASLPTLAEVQLGLATRVWRAN